MAQTVTPSCAGLHIGTPRLAANHCGRFGGCKQLTWASWSRPIITVNLNTFLFLFSCLDLLPWSLRPPGLSWSWTWSCLGLDTFLSWQCFVSGDGEVVLKQQTVWIKTLRQHKILRQKSRKISFYNQGGNWLQIIHVKIPSGVAGGLDSLLTCTCVGSQNLANAVVRQDMTVRCLVFLVKKNTKMRRNVKISTSSDVRQHLQTLIKAH